VLCARCGHQNPDDARFCSSCGSPLHGEGGDETTLTLSAVEAADEDDELERYLDELPDGVGLLVVREGPEAGSSYRIDQPETSIGRHPESDIFLDDITVSRRHVVIERSDAGQITLKDVGSLNGTYVNRKRVDEAELHYRDEVQIGRYRLSVVIGGERERRDGAE
jgi:hypothetical protein